MWSTVRKPEDGRSIKGSVAVSSGDILAFADRKEKILSFHRFVIVVKIVLETSLLRGIRVESAGRSPSSE